MANELSLTKHYVFDNLVADIARLRPGMTERAVYKTLRSPHGELADDIFSYQGGRLVDSVLLQTCRDGGGLANGVLWVSLIAADWRLRKVLEAMRLPDGSLDESQFATTWIEGLFASTVDVSSRKAASNLAHYFDQAEILVVKRSGQEIVGVTRALDTAGLVPVCVAHLADVFTWRDPPQDAIDLGVHTWLNLDADHFRSLAGGGATAPVPEQSSTTPPVAPVFTGDGVRLPYVDQDVDAGIAAPQRRRADSDAIENATREHRRTQNELADWARESGFETVRPNGEPLFDVGWWSSDALFIAEVKSLGADNEARQVRLGLGQVLDYRKQLQDAGTNSTAVLAVSRKPAAGEHWSALASEHGVVFCWPPFDALDAHMQTASAFGTTDGIAEHGTPD